MKQLKLSNQIAVLGEGLALRKLLSLDYEYVTRNYLEKTGEIDIIMKKDCIYHFIEVKSVSCENIDQIDKLYFKPEYNVTKRKITRLSRTIELYMTKQAISHETKWQIDLILVYISRKTKQAKLNIIRNINL